MPARAACTAEDFARRLRRLEADLGRLPMGLHHLAGSAAWYQRRAAIVATYYFIRHDVLNDTFAIADVLAHDPETRHHYLEKRCLTLG